MMRLVTAFALLLLLPLTTPAQPTPPVSDEEIEPMRAIWRSATIAPLGLIGTFVMPVRATGTHGERTFLNSEHDYRDQRNLTVALSPEAATALEARLGKPIAEGLRDRRIRVRGAAERVRIKFFDRDGKPTDKYYYQTHINVDDASAIDVLEQHETPLPAGR